MIVASRPLRFLVVALGGWIGIRAMMLWPAGEPLPTLADVIAPPAAAEQRAVPIAATAPAYLVAPSRGGRSLATVLRPPARFDRANAIGAPATTATTVGAAPPLATGPQAQDEQPPLAGSPLMNSAPAAASRFAGSAWLIVRGGGGASPFVPQLGGSQTGVRLTYALDDARRLSLAGRVSSALGSRQREAAIGVDWQPTRLPIHVVAEQRIAIEQARGGPSLGVIAGLPATPIAAGFTLDGYGQAGIIARDGGEGYADGSLRLTRPMASIGRTRLEIGLGAWGAAQRGASRLDIGPSASLVVPLAARAVRLSAEWRARIAGNARPATGPALSIGTDF